MTKKFLLAAFPVLMGVSSAMADDSLLTAIANLNDNKDSVAQVESADLLGKADVDALLGDDESNGEEAVAACYRRMYGHSYGSYGYSSCGYSNYCYNSYYRPVSYSYSYNYCAPVQYTYYTPVTYSCYSPCYTGYWGCW